MDNQLVWRFFNASLFTQSAPSPPLLTLPYLPNQPPHPYSSPFPIGLISPITPTPHPPLSAQSAPSPPLLTLPYLPNQPHLPHSSPFPICLSAPSASLITLPYLPNQPHLPHSSPFPICPISLITPTHHPPLSPKQVKFFQKPTLLSYLSITLFT